MTPPATVSVVVVSRGRPHGLLRTLRALTQLYYPWFEVIVVADPKGCAALGASPLADIAHVIAFDTPNISAARTLGVAAAAGEIVAFIDDDAVPEPTWLDHLAGVFADPDVAAAGGFVRGRNGISWQWRADWVDGTGATEPISVIGNAPQVVHLGPGRALRLQGTNMAVRRDVLARLGGFDPRYRFFLDETDLAMRMAEAGLAMAIVPLAQVHHGFFASDRRRGDRVPRDLFEIGAGWAVYLARHCPQAARPGAWARARASERSRLLRHLVTGRIEPRDLRRLMAGLAAGFDDGAARAAPDLPPLAPPARAFRPLPVPAQAPPVVIAGRPWTRGRDAQIAAEHAQKGRCVTLIRLSPTTLFHRITYTEHGYWLHHGGQYGKSERDQPVFRPLAFDTRIAQELSRLRAIRLADRDYMVHKWI